MVRHGSRIEREVFWGRLGFRLRRWLFVQQQRYGIRQSVRNVERHYDFGDDLFASFLDSKLNYTCADFENGAETIEEAQETKLTKTLNRLRLQNGDRLLEIGCGWGALALMASKDYGANVTALTLSNNQLLYSQRACSELNVKKSPRFLLEDYRQHEIGRRDIYDKVVSVGMLEHVGFYQLRCYFSEVYRLLKPGGLTLVHTIARRKPGVTNAWIDRHIFPGGYIAADREILDAAAANGLTPAAQPFEYLPHNYILTLRHWADRFHCSWGMFLKSKYPERMRRTYDFYFAASEAAFRELDMRAVQFLFEKRT